MIMVYEGKSSLQDLTHLFHAITTMLQHPLYCGLGYISAANHAKRFLELIEVDITSIIDGVLKELARHPSDDDTSNLQRRFHELTAMSSAII